MAGAGNLSFSGKMKAAAVLCLLAGPSVAEVEPDEMQARAEAVIVACLEESALVSSCIEEGAGACVFADERSVGASVGPCLGAENAVWAARLAASLALIADDAFAERVGGLELAGVVATFGAYREATCDVEGALWRGGEGPAWMGCRLRITVEQALRLDDWVRVLR